MYQSPVSFQAPLEPRSFFAEDALAQESRHVFEATWQLIGLVSSIKLPGQFLSAQVGSVPVVVRNFDGKLVALRNVCAHRHCTLVSSATGQSETLKCPFHGWEYGSDGRTRKIPAAKNFPNFDREHYRLAAFPLEQCGDLLFVRIAIAGPSLREWLGDLYNRIEEWTTVPTSTLAVSRILPLPANWKIPVEASLESYHIPEVHAQTFGEDPGESKSDHAFSKYTTSFFTAFNTPRLIDKLLKVYEQLIMRILGAPFAPAYEHHHVFPNLLISNTSSLTLVQTVSPLSAETAVSQVWQYRRLSVRRNPFSKLTAFLWGRFTGWLSYQILKEDISIFSRVQRGARAAKDRAILGRCEERLYAFEKFLSDQIAAEKGHETVAEDSMKSGSCRTATMCSESSSDAEVTK